MVLSGTIHPVGSLLASVLVWMHEEARRVAILPKTCRKARFCTNADELDAAMQARKDMRSNAEYVDRPCAPARILPAVRAVDDLSLRGIMGMHQNLHSGVMPPAVRAARGLRVLIV